MKVAEIIDKKLHSFAPDELHQVKALADTIFEPLVRPFHQHRKVEQFSIKQTIKTAMRVGALMPTYEKKIIEHRKSRLVIFMSLSGIDRCSAVSLIPLFNALRKSALDFRLFIYTDDVVQAEFTKDGYLANDYLLAWNNVAGPVVFNSIVNMPVNNQEDTLLLIDSFGGGDSKWFEAWDFYKANECHEEQKKYMATAGRNSWAQRVRKELNGNFSKINNCNLPQAWEKLIDRNCNERWMETPSLQEYMIRWLFHPKFGTVSHGKGKSEGHDVFELIGRLRGKYKKLHLLTPNMGEYNSVFSRIKRMNVFDYHHRANTIRGFAEVLGNIVHGNSVFESKYTKKISYEKVKLGEYRSQEFEETESSNEPGEHTELVEGSKKCFADCDVVEDCFPKEDYIKIGDKSINFGNLDVSEFFPNIKDWTNSYWWSEFLSKTKIEVGDSLYTKNVKAQKILDLVKNYELKSDGDDLLDIRSKQRGTVDVAKIDAVLSRIDFETHRTRCFREDIRELIQLLSPSYLKHMEEVPLRHVVWCNDSLFDQNRLAISVRIGEQNREEKKCHVWHEFLHWIESVCHPIGCFTNQLIAAKCSNNGKMDLNSAISVGRGEKAMPVMDGSTPWIKSYAGKWYERKKDTIPNQTEILTVYGEYFTSKERLAKLLEHDPFMVKFIAFILMGGPLAAMDSMKEAKRREALEQMRQKDRPSKSYKIRRSSGGGGGGRRSYTPKKSGGFGL